MKKYFLFVFVLTLLTSTSAFAQTKLDPKIYDKNGFRLDQKMPVRSILLPPVNPTATSTAAKLKTATTTKVDLTPYKQGEPASCFDYYTFGSIAVNLNTNISKYNPGDVVILRGEIKNNNKHPITNLTVRARLVKDIPNPVYLRSEIITLGDFDIAKDITLDAGKSFAVNYSHLLPLNAPKGEYKILFYAYNSDRFNQSGLSFTNDITASSLGFEVDSNNPQQIYLDQTKITLNDQVHNVMAFMTNHEKYKVINISIPLVNPSNVAEDMTVTYNLYKWDELLEKNKVDTKTEKVTVSAKGKVQLTYAVDKTDVSVYFLNITADNTNLKKDKSVYDIKTESNIRFTVSGLDYPRINSFGVNTYPIKANQENTLFTCYHNGASQNTLNPVNINTVLYDENNKVVAQTEYAGKINGNISAIVKKFTLKKDLVNFKTVTTLTDNDGKVIDTIENSYNCKDINSTICPAESNNFFTNLSWVWMLVGLIVLIAVIVGAWMIRKSKVTLVVLMLFVGLSMLGQGRVEAAVVKAPFEYSQTSSYGAYEYFTGTFQKEFNFIKSGVNLTNTNTNILNVGEIINSVSTPTTGYWFMRGDANDSPPMDGRIYGDNSANWSNEVTVQQAGAATWGAGVGIPIESGNINITSADPTIVSCDSVGCKANGPGTTTVTVSFGTVEQVSPYRITCEEFNGMFHANYYHSRYFTTYEHDGWALLSQCISGKHSNTGDLSAIWAPYYIPSIWGYYYHNASSIVSNGVVTYDNGFGKLDFLGEKPTTGYGLVNVYTAIGFEDYSNWEDNRSVPFSFPSITYTITVPTLANYPQVSSCAGTTVNSPTSATVNWTYSDSENDLQTGYKVQIATDSLFNNIIMAFVNPPNTDVSNVRSVQINGLSTNTTTYYSRVMTHNDVNGDSVYDACTSGFGGLTQSTFSVTCSANPVATGTDVTFKATAPGATSYLWSSSATGNTWTKTGGYQNTNLGTEVHPKNTETQVLVTATNNLNEVANTSCFVTVGTAVSNTTGSASVYMCTPGIDGIAVASGTKRTFYKSRISSSCAGADAFCINGALLDSSNNSFRADLFKYRTCVTPVPSEF